MSKVTSKLQVTIPKAIARTHGIAPGQEIVFESAGETIRVRLADQDTAAVEPDRRWRLELFDRATARQARRERRRGKASAAGGKKRGQRGWRREDLYDRGLPR